jgi:hypothetical protein
MDNGDTGFAPAAARLVAIAACSTAFSGAYIELMFVLPPEVDLSSL